jgi:hypothetical protein
VDTVIEFIQKQLETSEKLFNLMMEDHKERMKDISLWGEMNAGLMHKLDQRDAEIVNLRNRLQLLEEELARK